MKRHESQEELSATSRYSTGNWSTGDYSTGYRSTGDWSTGNYSTGHFSTLDYGGFGSFNKPCSIDEWNASIKPRFLYFKITEWIPYSDMTQDEKIKFPESKTTDGFLKTIDYKTAFQNSYESLAPEEKEIQTKMLRALPNFDAEVFYEISGIDLREESK